VGFVGRAPAHQQTGAHRARHPCGLIHCGLAAAKGDEDQRQKQRQSLKQRHSEATQEPSMAGAPPSALRAHSPASGGRDQPKQLLATTRHIDLSFPREAGEGARRADGGACAFALALALALALAIQSPFAAVRAWQISPSGWARWIAPSLLVGRMPVQQTLPGPHELGRLHRPSAASGRVSFGYFIFARAKKSDPLAIGEWKLWL
jgi:hypothetical protein